MGCSCFLAVDFMDKQDRHLEIDPGVHVAADAVDEVGVDLAPFQLAKLLVLQTLSARSNMKVSLSTPARQLNWTLMYKRRNSAGLA